MAAYRVLVSHRDLRMKTVVHLEPTVQVQYLVDAGYLKRIEEVQYVAGTDATPDGDGLSEPEPGSVADLAGGGNVRRPRRKAVKAEVVDGPDRSVPDSGPADSEG